MITLITLNLWRYYDFETRLENIVGVLNEKSPDVLLLQEVQIDPAHSPFSQAENLQKSVPDYKYIYTSAIYIKNSQQGKKLDVPVQHGMAILSKHPIVNTFEYYVSKNEGEDEPRMVQCADISIDGVMYKIANIHFANKEDWAKNQFKEFLNYTASRGEKRIMAGDFNMYHFADYAEIYRGYTSSYDYKQYVSYTKDGGTLDYVLIPDEYVFAQVEPLAEYMSDHAAVWGSINSK